MPLPSSKILLMNPTHQSTSGEIQEVASSSVRDGSAEDAETASEALVPAQSKTCVQRSSLENTESFGLYHRNTAMRYLLTVTTNASRDARSVTNSKVLKPWLRSRNGPVLAASRANLTRILSRAINKVGLLGLAFRLMELSMNQVGSEHVCAPARFWTRR